MPARAAAIVTHPGLARYDFGPQHPMRPERIAAGLELLRSADLWDEQRESISPEPADVAELALIHDPAYIQAVEQAGLGDLPYEECARYGLTSGDNPPFPDMHYAASIVAGGALTAVRDVMEARVGHAFHPAGGWHHAQRARAAGFCIYNDPALAAAAAVYEYDARVLSIDLDCHHGDGVQGLFYDSPRVFTLSFHESGKFLFPGTGEVAETGAGAGTGYALNVPFAPFSQDACWRAGLELILEEVTERFRPDIIISNHGCDTHVWDPITHLCCTTGSLQYQVALVHRLAEQYAGGRWLAVGSGGYDWRRVVPRSWSIVWAEMTERATPAMLPPEWVERWLDGVDGAPTHFLDEPDLAPAHARAEEITAFNLNGIMTALQVFRSNAVAWH